MRLAQLFKEGPHIAGMDMTRAQASIPSVDKKGEIVYGFDTFYRLSLKFPRFYAIIPLMWFLKQTYIGSWAYQRMAKSRIRCTQAACEGK